jgi:predicted MPP superfamily phosphohydrolase
MKIIVIPDVHGRDYWKSFADIRHLVNLPNLATEYDKYIFLGDAVDSYDKTNVQILHNLKEIIQFKKNYPDNVILLLGNHDNQYYFSYDKCGCSGYRPEAYWDLHELYNQNKDLFQPIYHIDMFDKGYLFTHAGITSVWFSKLLHSLDSKYHNMRIKNKDVYDIITEQFYLNNEILFDVGRTRGGWNKSGGPFWCDKSELTAYMLPNYTQIVGHTPVKEITIHENKQQNAKAIFCDTTYDYYELEI